MQAPDCCFLQPVPWCCPWWQWHWRVGSSLTLWHVQGPEWFCLWALDLVEVGGSRAGGETSVSRGCSMSLVSSLLLLSLEFLLLWLVCDWLSLLSLVREAHPPYFLQVGTRCQTSSSSDGCGGGFLRRALPTV
ncbi:hypothetical protein Taro_024186 [Colocasia esculenta]|uniref:Uncharacterized protein n=1 Tax=Colocasia esculenta TaxID=4460 RepID=A0A843VCZ6_COLES|nr:hypothetical protein [Colocasia esculenta]